MLMLDQTAAECDTYKIGAGERRKGLRLRQERPVKVFIAPLGKYVGGSTQDVSSAGLRIELPWMLPLQTGDLLHVLIGSSDNGQTLAARRHMTPARVVWVERDTARLVVGVEFLTGAGARLAA